MLIQHRSTPFFPRHKPFDMKFTVASLLALAATAVTASPTLEPRASKPKGLDVSHYQGTVNFAAAKSKGVSFAFIKATEGHSTSSPSSK